MTRRSVNPWLNYAIPDDDAVPSTEDVSGLTALYRARQLQPRLEYIPSCAPAVEAILVANGYQVENRLSLMVYQPGSEREPPSPAWVSLSLARSMEEFAAVRRVQHEGYGDPTPPTGADVESLAASITAGGLAILASKADEPIGAGQYTPPHAGLVEVTSLAVREQHRRRGVAGALTTALTRAALQAGARPFLMADADEVRIYARAGYQRIGEILTVGLPAKVTR